MQRGTAGAVPTVGVYRNHFSISVEFNSSRTGHAQTHAEEGEGHHEDLGIARRLESVDLLSFLRDRLNGESIHRDLCY